MDFELKPLSGAQAARWAVDAVLVLVPDSLVAADGDDALTEHRPSAAVRHGRRFSQAAKAGVSEVKLISIEQLRGTPPTVSVSVSQTSAMSVGADEIKSLVFTTPYSTKGQYQISMSGGTTQMVRFVQNDVTNNRVNIQTAFAALLGALVPAAA